MQSKSMEQLENDYWKEQSQFPSNLIKRCFEYRKIKVSELTIEQIRLLISQKIGIELFYLNKYNSISQLKKDIKEYIKYYNKERIKGNLNGMSPTEYRNHYYQN